MRSGWTVAVLLASFVAGCASLEDTVRTRAAHDFHCQESDLKVVDREQTVFRIAGCGEEATYVCTESRNLRVSCKRAEWDTRESAKLKP